MTLTAEDKGMDLVERDQFAGQRVQQNLLPSSGAKIGKLSFDYRILPSLILSGDSIEFVELSDGRVVFYIADVSGHGAAGALVSVLVKGICAGLMTDIEKKVLEHPSNVLEALNSALRNFDIDQHVTMFLGILDPKNNVLHFSNAAHFPAPILIADQSLDYLEFGSLPLGIYQSPDYQSKSLHLPNEYTIVMFSDGVLETMDQPTIKDKEERLQLLVRSGKRDVDSLAKELGIDGARNAPDDIAIFTITSSGR